jgi:hypothetical protein
MNFCVNRTGDENGTTYSLRTVDQPNRTRGCHPDFSMIGVRYITDPVHYSTEIGVSLGSALASTTTRVGSGAIPLGLAIFTVICLFSARWLFAGVGLVSIVITTAIIVRVLGLVIDGPAARTHQTFHSRGSNARPLGDRNNSGGKAQADHRKTLARHGPEAMNSTHRLWLTSRRRIARRLEDASA